MRHANNRQKAVTVAFPTNPLDCLFVELERKRG